jgi:hypothetical protein
MPNGEPYSKYQNNLVNYLRNIPYVLFSNRHDSNGDLTDVEEIYFATLNASYQMLTIDMLISRTFAYINNRLAKPNEFENILLDPSKNVLTNQNSSMTFGGTGINFLQGLPQSQSI